MTAEATPSPKQFTSQNTMQDQKRVALPSTPSVDDVGAGSVSHVPVAMRSTPKGDASGNVSQSVSTDVQDVSGDRQGALNRAAADPTDESFLDALVTYMADNRNAVFLSDVNWNRFDAQAQQVYFKVKPFREGGYNHLKRLEGVYSKAASELLGRKIQVCIDGAPQARVEVSNAADDMPMLKTMLDVFPEGVLSGVRVVEEAVETDEEVEDNGSDV